MTNLSIYAGVDVSKHFFDVCLVVEGKETLRQFRYDDKGMAALRAWLPKGCFCVMEATGPYSLRLATGLYQAGYPLSVVNPLVIKRFSQMRLLRAKTDRSDARLIAAYARREEPPLWQPPAAYLLKLQQLEALHGQLTKQGSAMRCQQEAFRAGGMMDKEIEQFLARTIRQLKEKLLWVEKKTAQLIEEHHRQLLQNLTTIPGIGRKTASVLIVLSQGFEKFGNARQLAAYVGLSPRIYESGTSVRGKTKTCKMGMSKVRALLYVCAWSAKRCNRACSELYERLLQKGKAKKLALIAVANKLIKQAFAIAKTNTPYQENYLKNTCS